MAEFLLRDAALLRGRKVNLRELVPPVPGPASIDDGTAVGVVAHRLALGLDAGIERGRPGIADDVDRRRGIRAREHGPDQLLQVGYVDVLIDDDNIAAAVGPDVAHRGDMTGLLGVAGIALRDGNAEEKP